MQAAATLYVANATATFGDGSLDFPFSDLQSCVDVLGSHAAGSSCLLLEGHYRFNRTVIARGLHGAAGAPYTIGSAPGHTATIDGTLDVETPWQWRATTQLLTNGTALHGGHWVASWPDDGRAEPWQLFVDDEMMIPARWPNARWDDKTVFDDTYWAHGSKYSTYCGPELRDLEYAGPCQLVDGTSEPTPGGSASLAASGINATGAAAVLNIGHWFSYGALVLSHAPGSRNFTYERDAGGGGWKSAKYKPTADLYFLEGALALLDAETEWHYERATRELHLRTRGDADPNDGMRVHARVQEYALAIGGCSHVTVRDLAFFATTVYAGGEANGYDDDVHHVSFDSLSFTHPSASKRVLGECRFSWPTTLARKKGADASNNTLFNCARARPPRLARQSRHCCCCRGGLTLGGARSGAQAPSLAPKLTRSSTRRAAG